MVTTAVPSAPAAKANRIGLEIVQYKGNKSTLCAGCGHNAISERIIEACFEMGVEPHRVAKFSGIGCSSKSPAYFLNSAYGVNAVHGRMPSVATGALLANHHLIALGVSGDGDTASIGIGQFVHLMRRNLPLLYIIEDNGVYGLTKGQFSATADVGSKLKTGVVNDLPPIDTCALAIQLGATYVARSFSGDKKQLLALLKGALAGRYYYVFAVDYTRGGEWSGRSLMCTKDSEFTIRGVEDCLARGFDRNGFFEVDTREQKSWTIQLTDPNQPVQPQP